MFQMHNSRPGFYGFPPKNTFFYPEGEGGTPPPAAEAATDNGNGAGNGEGAAAPSGEPAGKTFTQADVDRIVTERAKRAEESAVRSLLAKNKFEKPEDLERFIADSRQKADAELSEVERMKKMLDEAPKTEAVTELQQQLEDQSKVIVGLVEGLIKELNVPKHIVSLLQDMTPTKQLEYINSNRDAFKPTPTPPNLNGGDKGAGKQGDKNKAVRQKYGIRRRTRS